MRFSNINFKIVMQNKIVLIILVFILLLVSTLLLLPSGQKKFEATHGDLRVLVSNIQNHYKARPDYWGLNTETAIKNNLVPAKMVKNNQIINSLGRQVIIGQDIDGNLVMPANRTFMISFTSIGRKACTSLLSQNFNSDENLRLRAITITTSENHYDFTWNGNYPLPITNEIAETYCQNNNTISWSFE